jgi:outer membrane protein assembly factor BamE (lipoprotein component of BamABCDE complex)
MRKTIRFSLLIAVIPAILSGCSFDRFASMSEQQKGTEVSAQDYSRLVPGQTASAEVQNALGRPSRVQKKLGREVWVYTFHRFNSNPMITTVNSYQAVFLEFDDKGVLNRRWRKETRDDAGI